MRVGRCHCFSRSFKFSLGPTLAIISLSLVVNSNCVLCSAISVTVLVSNKSINFVVKSLFIGLLVLNILTSLTNISLMVVVALQFDSVLVRDYQLTFYWSLLTYSTLNYEISRMRYYCAKHAFRIHKFASCFIAAQVWQCCYRDQVIMINSRSWGRLCFCQLFTFW